MDNAPSHISNVSLQLLKDQNISFIQILSGDDTRMSAT